MVQAERNLFTPKFDQIAAKIAKFRNFIGLQNPKKFLATLRLIC